VKQLRYLALILLAIALPFLVPKYYLHLLILTGIYCIAVFGLNVVMGYTGQASLCQASFFGIAAYASALLTLRLGLSFWAAAPISILLIVILSAFLGVVTLRLVSHYFAICTFGLSEIALIVLNNWISVTNGPGGIQDIRPPEPIPVFPFSLIDLTSRLHYYYFVLFFLLLTIAFVAWLMGTRTGNAFLAIREDQELAQAEGIHVMKYKVYSFVLSAIIASIAGCLYAHYLKFLTPEMFTILDSLNMVIVLLIGGTGTIAGPILGSVINVVIPELLNVVPEQRMIAYGVFVILFIIFIPEGLVGLTRKLLNR
jgi:branched-chain amino acid transport system permease protein